jgi:HK97 family phage portal protein
MNFFEKLFKRSSTLTTVPSIPEYKQAKINYALQGNTFDFTRPELCSSVYTAISVIAGSISKLPVHVYRKTDKGTEQYKEHSWYNTLRYSPDSRLSTAKWLNHAICSIYLTGNAFYLKSEFDQTLNPTKSLKYLGAVDKVIQHENEIWYKFENVASWIPSKDLIHFYLISKDGGITGLNPIASIRSELEIQYGAESTTKNFYKNNATSMLYLEADLEGVAGSTTKEKLNEYLDKFQKDFAGYQNSGTILRVPPMYKLKTLPLADLKFLESSKYTISQIASIFQVPGFYLGVQDNAGSYGKAEQQQIQFKNTCLSNITSILKNELEAKILTVDERNEGVFIDFDYSNLYDTDHESKANYYKTLASIGGVSINQIAEAFNFQKIDSPFADYHFIQSQNQAVEKYDTWGNNKLTAPSNENINDNSNTDSNKENGNADNNKQDSNTDNNTTA